MVREVDERSAMAIGLIENIQRDDLNPLEEAGALERLLNEFELTHQQVAEAVGKSRTTVTNLLRLLELEPEVKAMVEQSRLEMGHARALLGLKGPAQSEAARRVVAAGLSVRETERLVRRLQQLDQVPMPTQSKPATRPRRAPPAGRPRRAPRRAGGDPARPAWCRQAGDRLQQPQRARRYPGPYPLRRNSRATRSRPAGSNGLRPLGVSGSQSFTLALCRYRKVWVALTLYK